MTKYNTQITQYDTTNSIIVQVEIDVFVSLQ